MDIGDRVKMKEGTFPSKDPHMNREFRILSLCNTLKCGKKCHTECVSITDDSKLFGFFAFDIKKLLLV